MSTSHPVIAVTGSSGAGTSTVKTAVEHIFLREHLKAAIVEGDSFHKFDRYQMRDEVAKALKSGRNLSHFGPDGNHFEKLEALFRDYSETGSGKIRYYLHNEIGEHTSELQSHSDLVCRLLLEKKKKTKKRKK